MIKVGTDLVEIERIKKSIKNERFMKRIFSTRELEELKVKGFKVQSVAANFCAKEAFLKSIGKGLGYMKLNKIELLRKNSGEPYLLISDDNFNNKYKKASFSISITHTKEYALATVVAEFL